MLKGSFLTLDVLKGPFTKIETAQIVRVRMADLDRRLDAYRIVGAKAEELRRFARVALRPARATPTAPAASR